ncbi:hypothetical protein, partial [Enterococcus faecium]
MATNYAKKINFDVDKLYKSLIVVPKNKSEDGNYELEVLQFKIEQKSSERFMSNQLVKIKKWLPMIDQLVSNNKEAKNLCIFVLLLHGRVINLVNRKSTTKFANSFWFLKNINKTVEKNGVYKGDFHFQNAETIEREHHYFDLLVNTVVELAKWAKSNETYSQVLKRIMSQETSFIYELSKSNLKYTYNEDELEILDNPENSQWIKELKREDFIETLRILKSLFDLKLAKATIMGIERDSYYWEEIGLYAPQIEGEDKEKRIDNIINYINSLSEPLKCRGLDFIGTLGWTETYYEKIYKE